MCCFVNRQQRHIPSAAESITYILKNKVLFSSMHTHTHTAEERSDVRETEYIYISDIRKENRIWTTYRMYIIKI